MYDVIIIGAGPAGVSAALTLRARGKSVLIVTNDPAENPLAKAPVIENYPGTPAISGKEMVEQFVAQAEEAGVEIRKGHVISAMPFGEKFMVSIGSDFEECGALILATGKASGKAFPGEEELLGRGVSYCATCDGMLYRGKKVCVVGFNNSSLEEAEFLAGIGCQVTYVARKEPETLPEGMEFLKFRKVAILGENSVTALEVDDTEVPCDAVFVLRPTIAPTNLVMGLELEGPYIKVDRNMHTNIPGIFAAGDCTGEPLQVAKAVGEGQLAAFAAVAHLDGKAE